MRAQSLAADHGSGCPDLAEMPYYQEDNMQRVEMDRYPSQ